MIKHFSDFENMSTSCQVNSIISFIFINLINIKFFNFLSLLSRRNNKSKFMLAQVPIYGLIKINICNEK